MPLIDFAVEIIHFQPQRQITSYLWITDKTHAPKGQVAIQNSLQERAEIEVSTKNVRCVSEFRHLAIQQCLKSKLVRSFSIFVHLEYLHEIIDSFSYRPHPLM